MQLPKIDSINKILICAALLTFLTSAGVFAFKRYHQEESFTKYLAENTCQQFVDFGKNSQVVIRSPEGDTPLSPARKIWLCKGGRFYVLEN